MASQMDNWNRNRGQAKTATILRDKIKKPAPVASAFSMPSMPGLNSGLGPQGLDGNRDAWANALDTMSNVRTPDPLTAIAKVAGMGFAGYGQGKATKAKEEGSAAYKAKLADVLSGKADNSSLMGMMADPYADDNSQRMLMEMWQRNNPTEDDLQQRQLRDLQMQQTQQGMTAQQQQMEAARIQQEQQATAWQQQQDEIQRQQALRGGRMDAVEGFNQDFETQGGDLFDPRMQQMLRAQGIQGVNPADTQRYDAMQPYAQAGMYDEAFQQMNAPMAGADGTNWEQVTLDDGVYAVDKENPQNRIKIGERPNRNEGEGRVFTQEGKLRTEYMNESKPFTDLRTNYQRIQAASKDQTGASDIAMVYSFMKMLDPTSVVREGEFATAANAGGLDAKMISLYNQVINGQRLSPQVRAEFQQQADRQYGQQFQTYEQIRKKYGELATKLQLDPANVAPDISYGITTTPEAGDEGTPTADDLVRKYGGGR